MTLHNSCVSEESPYRRAIGLWPGSHRPPFDTTLKVYFTMATQLTICAEVTQGDRRLNRPRIVECLYP